MITIGELYIKEVEGWTELHAPVRISRDTATRFIEETSKLTNVSWLTKWDYPPASWDDEKSSLWFSVPSKYGRYLCKERSNAFVLALLWYAMITESDIQFSVPMSKRMYEGITKKLIPKLAKDERKQIKLIGAVSDEPLWNDGGVVTGLTCGVDSTYTLHKYEQEDIAKENKLTHIVYCHMDYLFPYIEPPYDIDEVIAEHERKYNKKDIENARIMAMQHRLPHIEIKTNFDRDYYRGGLIYNGAYRYFSSTMSLEHLFSKYIFSSSGTGDDKEEVSLFKAHYEDFLSECCSTENFHIIMGDHEERFNKLKAIADDTYFQKMVSVCDNVETESEKNCGECFGCWRTMVPLDMLGKLDKFDESFDLDKYYSNRRNIFEEMIRFSMSIESDFAKKMVEQILKYADECGEVGALFKEVYKECHGNK